VAYVKVTKPHLKKLDDCGTPVVFIGYEPGAKRVALLRSSDALRRYVQGHGLRRADILELEGQGRGLGGRCRPRRGVPHNGAGHRVF
jgi:hypothetical protein